MPDATDDGWGPERRVTSRSSGGSNPPPADRRPPPPRDQRSAGPAPALRSTVPPPIRAPRADRPDRPRPTARPGAPAPASPPTGAGSAARGGVAVRYRDSAARSAPAAGPSRPDAAGPSAAVPRTGARRASTEPQHGLVGWVAVGLMVVVAGLGGLIDAVGGSTLKGLFAIGLIIGSLAAILLVRRRDMFPVVIAPPLIYFGASAVLLYLRSGGFKDRGVLIDAVSNWLVYGFPAIAGASAVVLIVAGGRLLLNR